MQTALVPKVHPVTTRAEAPLMQPRAHHSEEVWLLLLLGEAGNQAPFHALNEPLGAVNRPCLWRPARLVWF